MNVKNLCTIYFAEMIRSNDKNQMIYCIFRVQTHAKYFLLQSVIELQRLRHILRDEDENLFVGGNML